MKVEFFNRNTEEKPNKNDDENENRRCQKA